MSEVAGPVMTVQEIEKLLPHRHPFLLVDRIVELEPDKRVVGIAQCSAIMALKSMPPEKRAGKVIYFMSIDGAKFRKPVVPGDRLELHCEMLRSKASLMKTRGEAKVDGQVVAEGEFMAMLAGGE
jgi:3-hydroxyacyl-[acyl-carrier-protein] dehydratase